MKFPDKLKFRVITISDRASRGVYEDLSGPEITRMIRGYFTAKAVVVDVENEIIPDEPDLLRSRIRSCKSEGIHVVFTTGGTGLGPRDITPEVIRPMLEKEIPGIMEMIRVKYGLNKPAALVSRSVAGLSGQTLIYCLPGSLKAVDEYTLEILPTLIHSIKMVLAIDDHHD
jgi:molybdenum cofactor synthesis domain-containing protein